jgi:hypothetical protein
MFAVVGAANVDSWQYARHACCQYSTHVLRGVRAMGSLQDHTCGQAAHVDVSYMHLWRHVDASGYFQSTVLKYLFPVQCTVLNY